MTGGRERGEAVPGRGARPELPEGRARSAAGHPDRAHRGVDIDAVGAWLAAGAVAVGLGGPLIGDALALDGDLHALAERAQAVCAAVGARQ